MFVLPETAKAVLIRTDFSDQQAWEACRSAIDASAMAAFDVSIEQDVEILDDPANRDITVEQLLALESLQDTDHTFVMLADRETMASSEHPILFLDLFEDQRGATIRVASAQMGEAIGNVDNGNITIEDYAAAARRAGDSAVFRGFA
ncbi:DUF6924 domain-containing protein [Nocardia vaccinii]|uniref:DUF6924 domain-containing protein n=1 Tax=Nocardia vaccinii TaxID=1822 RepID=UPI000837642A|nr:hypothetical protein [Nocardia vaccinii]